MNNASKIKAALESEGAATVGIAKAENLPETEHQFNEEMSAGFFAEMKWLSDSLHIRTHPSEHLSGAKSIICSAWPYSQEKKSKYFARYSLHEDYHKFILKKLKSAWLSADYGHEEVRYFVDSKPIAEKVYAAKSGVGWVGKNSLVINPDIGSFFCLGLILTKIEFEADNEIENLCGDCTLCIDACPTEAIKNGGVIDCNKCISYLTTEHKADVPRELRHKIGQNIFGCDICQDVCPYNERNTINNVIPVKNINIGSLNELQNIGENEFIKLFKGTPVFRLGRKRFIRNVTIALENKIDVKSCSA